MFVKDTCTQRDTCETCSLSATTFVKWADYTAQCSRYVLDVTTVECEVCTNVVVDEHLGTRVTICNYCGKEVIEVL